jgi:hypothetical protein
MTELEKLEKAEKHGLGFCSRLLKRDHRPTRGRGSLIGLSSARCAFLAGWESEQAPLSGLLQHGLVRLLEYK